MSISGLQNLYQYTQNRVPLRKQARLLVPQLISRFRNAAWLATVDYYTISRHALLAVVMSRNHI
jgi:hypothetical protein